MMNFKIIGQRNITNDNFLSLVIGNLNCVAFGIIRPLAGFLSDTFGQRKCLMSIFAMQFILCFLIIPSSFSELSFAIVVPMAFFVARI